MAFVVPQHLPRSSQHTGYGSTTSHAEPVLRKLAEATRGSLTSDEASEWVEELQKSILETKARVHQRIQKDTLSFEQCLISSKQIAEGLHEITSTADDLATCVQDPQTGLLPTLVAALGVHSTLAQHASDTRVLQTAVDYVSRCRDEFKVLSTLVENGHLPAAVHKVAEVQSLVKSAPRPLERAAIMNDLSRLARVLGDRVQEQLGDAYARAVAVTPFPNGVTVSILPQVSIRNSDGTVTLAELFASLKLQSLAEHLALLRKDILTKVIEPVLTKPSRLSRSSENKHASPRDSTLTIEYIPTPGAPLFQHAHDALSHTSQLIAFIHDALFPSLPSQNTFATQLAIPLTQAIINHVLCPAIPRSGSLEQVPGFLKIAAHSAEIEEALDRLGVKSSNVREWVRGAPGHYERRRREDLVQQVRSTVLERDNSAVAVKRTIVRELIESLKEERDPWALEEPASKATLGLPAIAPPAPQNVAQSSSEAALRVVDQPPRLITPPVPPPLELPEVDSWGFDDDEPDIEVDAGTSQSEGARTGASGDGSGSVATSHTTELLSAPHSDAEIVNAVQSSEESDPWDDDPWGDQTEATTETENPKDVPTKVSTTQPAPTLLPTTADVSPNLLSTTTTSKVEASPAPVVVEIPSSPAVHAPSPRLARGLQRFAQKHRGSPSPGPSKLGSPAVSNASPTVSHISSSIFGTAPSSAHPQSALYESMTGSYKSPPKPNVALPDTYGSPIKELSSLPPTASFVSSKPPTIAPPITPAMRRAQQHAKLLPGSGASDAGSASSSVVGSPPKRGPSHRQQGSTGSGIGVFGEIQEGDLSAPGSPRQRISAIASLKEDSPIESYLVSRRAQKVLGLAESALKEGKELVSTNIFPVDTSPAPGSLILSCIPSFFDLFRALVPVAHGASMATSGGNAMRFSNDCTYLSQELTRLISDIPEGKTGDAAKPKFEEVQERLRALGESWFDDVLEKEKLAIARYLEPTERFKDIADQARYQDCKRAVTRCTQALSKFSRDTKPVLPSTKYYLALGALVEGLLARIIEYIITMQDIPKTESDRLHEICKSLDALESLFILEDGTTSGASLYVPSWFKCSYLAELLRASFADFRHLFDEGNLIDFSERDLVHLVHALFSDSPKRQGLIDRILAGHPEM